MGAKINHITRGSVYALLVDGVFFSQRWIIIASWNSRVEKHTRVTCFEAYPERSEQKHLFLVELVLA